MGTRVPVKHGSPLMISGSILTTDLLTPLNVQWNSGTRKRFKKSFARRALDRRSADKNSEAASLGITRENQQLLADALRKAAADSADVILMGDQGFGETFEIRFSLATDKGQATVLSGWIVRRDEDFPRLVTCFIV